GHTAEALACGPERPSGRGNENRPFAMPPALPFEAPPPRLRGAALPSRSIHAFPLRKSSKAPKDWGRGATLAPAGRFPGPPPPPAAKRDGRRTGIPTARAASWRAARGE